MATIECKPDGPYLVKDLEVLVGPDGNRITANAPQCGSLRISSFFWVSP